MQSMDFESPERKARGPSRCGRDPSSDRSGRRGRGYRSCRRRRWRRRRWIVRCRPCGAWGRSPPRTRWRRRKAWRRARAWRGGAAPPPSETHPGGGRSCRWATPASAAGAGRSVSAFWWFRDPARRWRGVRRRKGSGSESGRRRRGREASALGATPVLIDGNVDWIWRREALENDGVWGECVCRCEWEKVRVCLCFLFGFGCGSVCLSGTGFYARMVVTVFCEAGNYR